MTNSNDLSRTTILVPGKLSDRARERIENTFDMVHMENADPALVTPELVVAAEARGLSPRAFLDRHDGFGFFAELDGLVVTGPSHTNVNDFRAVLVQ